VTATDESAVTQPTVADTASRILDEAERLVQTRGFNGFSYADVAAELGVSKAALHYHFAGKAELGEALIRRYAARFSDGLSKLDASPIDAREKLGAYAGIYADVLRDGRMCLCGMLAAEYRTLPDPMREAVVRFFEDNEAWLEAVLERGKADGQLRYEGSAREVAEAIVSGLEGAMLVARPLDDVTRFEHAAARLLDGLTATGS
jgi:TetR/AcrR family transcriptional regulator, transcriptional repressor for nem operon